MESCGRIKDGNRNLALGEDEVRGILKDYFFRDLYNIDSQEEVAVPTRGYDGVQRGNYFREEPIRRNEVGLREGKLTSGKAVGKDEVTGEMVKMEVTWWWTGNVAFETSIVLEDWRSVFVPLYKSKGERTEFKNYGDIILLSVFEKIYARILVYRVSRVTEGLIDDKQGVLDQGGGV